MMFDHLETTEKRLIEQIKAACSALEFIRSVTAEDTLPRLEDGSENPLYTQWVRHMNILNTARVDIQMAGEYLHEELNNENDDKCIAWKQLERELERKKKKKPLQKPAAKTLAS